LCLREQESFLTPHIAPASRAIDASPPLSLSGRVKCTRLMLCLSFYEWRCIYPGEQIIFAPFLKKPSLDRARGRFADNLFVPKHAKADVLLTTVLGLLRGRLVGVGRGILRAPHWKVRRGGVVGLKARTRKHPGLELCCDRRPSICVYFLKHYVDLKHASSRFTWHVAILFMHCIGLYLHVPAGVHGQARAPEPSAPERAGPPPRRRRACESPKSRTARRQPDPPEPSGLTPTSAFAAATAQPTRPPGQTPRYSRLLVHGGSIF